MMRRFINFIHCVYLRCKYFVYDHLWLVQNKLHATFFLDGETPFYMVLIRSLFSAATTYFH